MDTRDSDEVKTVIQLGRSYHPYGDKILRETEPDLPNLEHGSEPLNDAVKYGNVGGGRQRVRTLSDYPRRQRIWVRLSAIVGFILFILAILSNFLHL